MKREFFLSSLGADQNMKVETIGFMVSEVIAGANVIKDIFAMFSDFFGGRSSKYEKALVGAKNEALDELIVKAKAQGANGIIGIKMDYEVVGRGGSMFMVNVTGTAVKIS